MSAVEHIRVGPRLRETQRNKLEIALTTQIKRADAPWGEIEFDDVHRHSRNKRCGEGMEGQHWSWGSNLMWEIYDNVLRDLPYRILWSSTISVC